jgi:hypothetical protein
MATGNGLQYRGPEHTVRCSAVQCSKIRRAAARLPEHPVVTAVTAHHRAQSRQSQAMVTRCAQRHGEDLLDLMFDLIELCFFDVLTIKKHASVQHPIHSPLESASSKNQS